MRRLVTLLIFALLAVGCAPTPESSAPSVQRPGSEAPAAPAPEPPALLKPEILVSTSNEPRVKAQVKAALEAAVAEGRTLVVYVGATWCEPCRRFHDAVSAGQLDDALAGVRFLEFDHDLHQQGLKAAGYLKRFVPLFAIPRPDGSASDRIHQGAIRGPGAVDFLMPRLKALLGPI